MHASEWRDVPRSNLQSKRQLEVSKGVWALPRKQWFCLSHRLCCCTEREGGRCAFAAVLLPSAGSCIRGTLAVVLLIPAACACCQDRICNLAFTFSPKLSAGLAITEFLNPTRVCWPAVYLIPLQNAFLFSIYHYLWQPYGGSQVTLKKPKL